MIRARRRAAAVVALAVLLTPGCERASNSAAPVDAHAAGAGGATVEAPTNRVDIPPAVRQNLGITFIRVEARAVEQTLRAPGRFEYLPSARREYRAMLPGRIELLVDQFERVDAGAPLFRIDSPAWHALQAELTGADAAVARASTRLASFGPLRAAHRNHEEQLTRVIDIRRRRIEQLESLSDAGAGRLTELNQARADVATAEAELAEVLEEEAELEADEAETAAALEAARSTRRLLLDTAATLTGAPAAALDEPADAAPDAPPLWRAMAHVTVHAAEAGVVESIGLTSGAWADEQNPVLTVVRPDRLRFHAVGLQSDLGRLRDGLPARIVAPAPTRAAGAIDLAATMSGTLSLALAGEASRRTIDLFVTPDALAPWARAGVSAHLEVVTDEAAPASLAIPAAAIQRDGLKAVFFRRDPGDPNKAIRVEGDLGLSDGRWTVVNSGVRLGDEIVLDGAFQLMLATSTGTGRAQGGHFHSDGTFHAGDHE